MQRRIAEAQTRKGALIAESHGQVQALLAKATAEVEVQRARLAQVRFQLIADKVKPAEARKAQMVAQARGAASKIIEDGKATARAIRSLGETWAKAGDSARQIFVAQKLQALVGTMMQTVGDDADRQAHGDRPRARRERLELRGQGGGHRRAAQADARRRSRRDGAARAAGETVPPVPPAVAAPTRPPTSPGAGPACRSRRAAAASVATACLATEPAWKHRPAVQTGTYRRPRWHDRCYSRRP